MNKIHNASRKPVVYFGLHMVEGVAEYKTPDAEPYRILVNESTIKEMDKTFQGCPVYVQHVDNVNLDNLQAEADGYVVRSFFNKADGKHWAEFIVVSDKGHEAITKGWRLSNAYVPKGGWGAGGNWHGVEYSKEVMAGEYEHLAIVENPRYDESVVLTPEQFKQYNSDKEQTLERIANSKGEKSVKFNFFKREKVENSADIETMSVRLKNGSELTISELVEKVENMSGYASGEHMVKVNDNEEMSVSDLSNKYNEMCKKNADEEEAKKKNAEDEELKKKNSEMTDEEKKKNEEEEKKKNEDAAAAEEAKKNSLDHFEALKNADLSVIKNDVIVELTEDKIARGKSRYGSN